VICGGFLVLLMDLILQYFFRIENIGYANRGVSFGFGPEVGSIISFIAFGGLLIWFVFELIKFKKIRSYIFLILLGGLGNIAGRVFWGSVWDYVCVPYVPFCFNFSDVLISIGVVSYILGGNGNRSTLRGQRDTGNQ